LTKQKIAAQAQQEEDTSLKEVVPGAANFEPVISGDEVAYYKAYDTAGKLAGIAFKAGAQGYSSVIETMAGMKKDGTIIAIKVLSQNETPGLGSQISQLAFTNRFSDISIQSVNDIQAITGATISSRAVIDSVAKRGRELWEQIKNE
jgi:electron transport complex protein RnfG